MKKCLPPKPMRSCRKKIGPGEPIRVTSMSKIISGSQTGSESRMQVISRADFQPGLRMLPVVVRIDMVTDMNPPCAETLPRIRSQRDELSCRKRVIPARSEERRVGKE